MTDHDRTVIEMSRDPGWRGDGDDGDGNAHVLYLCDLAEREAARADAAEARVQACVETARAARAEVGSLVATRQASDEAAAGAYAVLDAVERAAREAAGEEATENEPAKEKR